MNPGYAGRAELPDNLKALFRPCAMMIPDYVMICEIMLYAQGYADAKTLCVKVVKTLHLSNEQLSSQYHYDFGMRGLKAIITASGRLKLEMFGTSEDIIVLRALLDVNIPKFTGNDLPLFNSIMKDLFTGITPDEPDNSLVENVLLKACTKNNLQPTPAFIGKCI
jgi:dynein heavy chain